MNITKLAINNFLTIGSAEFDLDNRGLILIQGVNNDDTSAASNGAGKSSVVDAICWALFGTTSREVSGDDVINETVKKDCAVSVHIEDGDDAYLIQRHRKHKVHKNQLLVFQVPAHGAVVDISKGTDKETQEVVNKIIGCSLDVFVGSIYAGQEKMPDLPNMTDKSLKVLIEEAAGVEELADAYAEARKRHDIVNTELATVRAKVNTLETQMDTAKVNLDRAKVSAKEFEDGRSVRAKEELKQVKPLQDGKAAAEKSVSEIDEAALSSEKAALEKTMAEYRDKGVVLQSLTKTEREIGNKVERFRATVNVEKAAVERMEGLLAKIDSQVGSPCGECGKVYCEHDLEEAKVARQSAITLQKKSLLQAATGLKAAIEEQKVALKAVEDHKATMADVTETNSRLAEINATFQTLAKHKAAISEVDGKIEAVKNAARAKMSEANPWQKAIESQEKQAIDLGLEIVSLQKTVTELEDKVEVYADAVKVFGPAGVRAHILDTVTPFLNDRTGEYLDALSDGNIHAVWSTLSKTAKGDMKEKFNIEVTNDKGGKSFKAISGGEKRKVRIATAMALQDMVASRAAKPINLFMADEIDDSVDEPGLERLMTVLEKKAKERGTVLIVSHNSLADWCDQTITMTKTGGISTATGANQRGF